MYLITHLVVLRLPVGHGHSQVVGVLPPQRVEVPLGLGALQPLPLNVEHVAGLLILRRLAHLKDFSEIGILLQEAEIRLDELASQPNSCLIYILHAASSDGKIEGSVTSMCRCILSLANFLPQIGHSTRMSLCGGGFVSTCEGRRSRPPPSGCNSWH